MIDEVVNAIIAIISGYLLGSIPSAYIASRLVKSQDIRQMGGGNVGAHNTFEQVGKAAGVGVAIADVVKGAVAVAIAQWLLNIPLGSITLTQFTLDMPETFVLLTGLAVISGHIWSVYLKFTGGNGVATTIGVTSFLLPRELLVGLAIAIVVFLLARNFVLAMNSGLISVPVSTWFLEKSVPFVVFTIIIFFIVFLHFLPTIVNAFAATGSKENLINELLRRKKNKG